MEDRRLLVVGADFLPAAISPPSAFDGVVKFGDCTAAFLRDGRHVLTAAHCVDDDKDGVVDAGTYTITFEMSNRDITFSVPASRITLHPDWVANPGTQHGNDLAIIELQDSAGREVIGTGGILNGYTIFVGAGEIGEVFNLVGYGKAGNDGALGDNKPSGTKRSGMNRFQADGTPILNEVQSVEIIASGGTFTLDFEGDTTNDIAYDASPAVVEAELNALGAISGGGSVEVFGEAGLYFVNFVGGFAATDVSKLTLDDSNLTGVINADVDVEISGGHYTFDPGSILLYDFDDGSEEHNALNRLYGIAGTGLGSDTEAIQAPGDSGGPYFVNTDLSGRPLIAGIVSTRKTDLGENLSATANRVDIDPENSTFGEIGIVTRASFFESWISDEADDSGIDLVLDMTVQNIGDDGAADTIEIINNGPGQFLIEVNGVSYYGDLLANVNSILLKGSSDDDVFVVDSSFIRSLVSASTSFEIDGGPGANTVRLESDIISPAPYTGVALRPGASDSGLINIQTSGALGAGPEVEFKFDNIALVEDNSAAVLRAFANDLGAASLSGDLKLRLGDDGTPGNGKSEIVSTGSVLFPRFVFNHPSAQLVILTGDGNDELTVDFADENPIPPLGLTVDGGLGTNHIETINGSFNHVQYDATGPSKGLLDFDGARIGYSSVSLITDRTQAIDRTFSVEIPGDQQIRLSDDGDASNGLTRVDSNGTGAFAAIDFVAPLNALAANAGDGDDVFSVVSSDNSLGANLTPAFIILNGEGGNDLFSIATGNLNSIIAFIFLSGGAGDNNRAVLDDDGNDLPAHYEFQQDFIFSHLLPDCAPRPFPGLSYQDLASIELNGSQGENEFVVEPSAATEFFLHGNLPNAAGPGRDYLQIEFAGTTDRQLQRAAGDGKWTFGNRQDVNFTGIEKFNFFAIVVSGADSGGGPHVKVFDAETLAEVQSFFAYDPAFTGGVRVATGDLNNDGIPDIVTAAGPTGGPHVRVFDAASGQQLPEYGRLGSFFAYDLSGYAPLGIQVATGDFDGDGWDDLVTGGYTTVNGNASGSPLARPAPHVRVFSGRDGHELANFATKGINLAVGDINGDGTLDIVIGIDGHGRLPFVEVFNGLTGETLPAAEGGSFLAYDPLFRGGVYVAVGDVNGDGRVDIITGAGPSGGSHVRVFSGLDRSVIKEFFAYAPQFGGGVRVAAADLNGDGKADIITGAGASGGPHLRVFNGADLSNLGQRFAYSPLFAGGIFVAAHETTHDSDFCAVLGPGLRAATHDRTELPATPALGVRDVEQMLSAAKVHWLATGLSEELLREAVSSLTIGVANLPGNLLGLVLGHSILIDSDAAGVGWFIDPTPANDAEFLTDESGLLTALPGTAAAGRFDLLSAVVHELGHILGLADVDAVADPASIMADELAPGVRHPVSLADVDAVFAEGRF